MDSATKVFLDLSLEYQDLNNFYALTVMVLKKTLNWNASLYLDENGASANLVASTDDEKTALLKNNKKIVAPISDKVLHHGDEYLVPMQYRESTKQGADFSFNPVVGMLGVKPGIELDDQSISFLNKYADLAALSIVQRLLADKNKQHIAFIKQLVADIGHNVIVPNIFFKAYLRRLHGKIERLRQVEEQFRALSSAPPQVLPFELRDLTAEMAYANEGLAEEFEHIQKHYESTSLFLETLLRQSHFEQGQYVLQKKPCNFKRDIISPQVDRFIPKLKERGIEVDLSAGGVPDQPIEAVVDIGLLSQVYANLLSNAVKYTRSVSQDGMEKKFIAYGLEVIPEVFGEGTEGIKLNLFSTGKRIKSAEGMYIFNEGYRGSNVENERGTGHGLFFVKEVIELHGGRAGFESTDLGNNFFLMLPR